LPTFPEQYEAGFEPLAIFFLIKFEDLNYNICCLTILSAQSNRDFRLSLTDFPT
jgi:hypothetical protein